MSINSFHADLGTFQATDDDEGTVAMDGGVSEIGVGGAPMAVLDDVFGRVLRFHAGDYAVIGGEDFSVAAEFTLTAWIRPQATDRYQPAMSIWDGDLDKEWLGVTLGPRLELEVASAKGWRRVVGDIAVSPNQWVHVAVTFAQRTLTLYLDGVQAMVVDDVDGPSDSSIALLGGVVIPEPLANLDSDATGRVVFSHDSRWVLTATASQDGSGSIQMIDTASGDPRWPTGIVQTEDIGIHPALAFVDGDRSVLVGGSDHVWLFDAEQGTHRKDASGEEVGIAIPHGVAAISPDGRRLLVADESMALHLHDAGTLTPIVDGSGAAITIATGAPSADQVRAAFSPDGQTIAVITPKDVGLHDAATGAARTHDGEPARIRHEFPGLIGRPDLEGDYRYDLWEPVRGVVFSPDSTALAVNFDGEIINLHDARTGELQRAPDGRPIEVSPPDSYHQSFEWMEFSADGSTLVSYYSDTLRAYDLSTGKPRTTGENADALQRTGAVSAVRFRPDGRLLTIVQDGGCLLLDPVTWQPITDLDDDEITLDHTDDDDENASAADMVLTYSPDGRTLITATPGRTRIWDTWTLTEGFDGDVAHVQMHAEALHPETIVEQLKGGLPDIRVGTIFPLDFSLHNDQTEQALYLRDDPQQLVLELTNVSDRVVMLPAGEADKGTLELRFRPGTLDPTSISDISILDPPGWLVTPTTDPDGTVSLHLRRTAATAESAVQPTESDDGTETQAADADDTLPADSALAVGGRLALTLDGLRPDKAGGARVTRVQLRYRLRHHDGTPLTGSRLHYLRILHESDSSLHNHVTKALEDILSATAHRKQLGEHIDAGIADVTGQIHTLAEALKGQEGQEEAHYFAYGGPLVAGVVGQAAVRTGGARSRLTFRVRRAVPADGVFPALATSPPATFTLRLADASPGWGLLEPDDDISVVQISDGWAHTPDGGAIVLTPPDGLAQLDTLEVEVDVACTGKVGTGHVRIEFTGVGLPDTTTFYPGTLRVAVDRTTILAEDDRTTLASGTLLMESTPLIGMRTGRAADADEQPDHHGLTAAIDLASSGLRMKSTGSMHLHPGLPDVEADGPDVDDGAVPGVHVHGALSVTEAVNAQSSPINAKDLTLTGDIQMQPTSSVFVGSPEHGSYLVPPGAIVMWFGALPPPTGWVLCDGANDETPDLRSRFVVGAAGTRSDGFGNGIDGKPLQPYKAGAEGGEDHHTLAKPEMPKHNHNWKTPTDPGHNHNLPRLLGVATTDEDDDSLSVWAPRMNNPPAPFPVTDGKTGMTFVHDEEGADQPHENRPPFKALYFIMKRPIPPAPTS